MENEDVVGVVQCREETNKKMFRESLHVSLHSESTEHRGSLKSEGGAKLLRT